MDRAITESAQPLVVSPFVVAKVDYLVAHVRGSPPSWLSRRHAARTVATLDHRHFGVVRPLDGGRFTIVP